SRKLRNHPLRPVRRPDADVFAAPDAQSEQAAGDFIHVRVKFSVAASELELRKDQGIVIAEALGRRRQYISKRQAIDPGTFGCGHVSLGARSDQGSAVSSGKKTVAVERN